MGQSNLPIELLLTPEQLESAGYVANNIATAVLVLTSAVTSELQPVNPKCPLCGSAGGDSTGELSIVARGERSSNRPPLVVLHRVHSRCLESEVTSPGTPIQ